MSAFKYFSEVSKHIQSLLPYLPVLHHMEFMVIHVMANIIFFVSTTGTLGGDSRSEGHGADEPSEV